MDELILLAIIALLAVLAGTVLSFVNWSSIAKLRNTIEHLNHIVEVQQRQISRLLKAQSDFKAQSQSKTEEEALGAKEANSAQHEENKTTADVQNTATDTTTHKLSASENGLEREVSTTKQVKQANKTNKASFDLEKFLAGNGLLWLGGIVLAFGGVFLAKYSIEAGLFPPQLRILLGAVFGVALIAAAEYLYQHPKKFQINTPMISASIASGGLITCFAMAYVAFNFYAYLSPLLAFALLAIIAVAGTLMSVRYGPILALIGIVGAYAVPALISTGSNNVFALLIYVAFVSASAVWVHSLVKQTWVWWLTLVGNMAWLLISVSIASVSHLWIMFVFALFSIYLYVLVPVLGWKLANGYQQALSIKDLLMPRKEQLGILIPLLSIALIFVLFPFQSSFFVMLLIVSAVLLIAPFKHSAFDSWPYFALVLSVVIYFMIPTTYDPNDNVFPFTHAYLFVQIASFVSVAYCLLAIKTLVLRPSFLMLLVVSPLGLMGLAYALSPAEHSTFLYPVWSIELMVLAFAFSFLALKTGHASRDEALHKMTFLLLANGATTLTFTMLLSPSVLSLAIVIQVTLMTYFSKKFELLLPTWIYKIAVSAVIFRLSLAPWLPEYSDEQILSLHWSVVIYPLVLGLMWMGLRFLNDDNQQNRELRVWFKGAMLHVFALFVTTETSYLMSGQYLNIDNMNFSQSAIMSMNWFLLAALYLWRASLSANRLSANSKPANRVPANRKPAKTPNFFHKWSSQTVYTIYACILGLAAVKLHLDISLIQNPFLSYQDTGSGLFINLLLPMWLVPSLLFLTCIRFNVIKEKFVKPVLVAAGVFLVMYINGLIRGAYHPVLSFGEADILQQELYVYSLVWLAISICLIVLGQNKADTRLSKLGFILLSLVIFKAFIVDMNNLEGLYRAVSFIGLGLSLVGIGWLFQRLKKQVES